MGGKEGDGKRSGEADDRDRERDGKDGGEGFWVVEDHSRFYTQRHEIA